jgi:NAD(P)-dependent dehydrogenase (short-subunit alcohol dehydrogenase family)
MSLDRCRAVVTGAGGGLGRAFCLELAKRGARIVVSDVDAEGAEGTAAAVRKLGGQAVVAHCDVRDYTQVQALGDLADATYGGADLIINNAGVAVSGELGTVSAADWKWVLDINVLGVAHGVEVFMPRFRKQGAGYVINVASAAGLISGANLGPYNASKAAVVALSETLAAETRGKNINVTVLCPTFFQTNIMTSGRGSTDEGMKKMVSTLMARSALQANDVARIALEHVEKNQLFCVPMSDGRLMWRIKRVMPSLMPAILSPGGGMGMLQKLTRKR